MRQAFARLAAAAAFAPALAWAAPPTPDYRLVFADEFEGTTLDTMKWTSGYPWGNTHNHDAVADPSHAVVADGNLSLVAERREQGGKPFVTGVVSTGETKVTFDRGYVEARIKLPTTPGSWPAFWGLFTGWPPEADVMEFPLAATPGGDGYPAADYHTAFHFKNPDGKNGAGAGRVRRPLGDGPDGKPLPLNADYHTFGMEWVNDQSVRFYLDGRVVNSFAHADAVAQMKQMYLILNYAVGGWPGTPTLRQWPEGHKDETRIDWVRVWQLPEAGGGDATRWKAGAGVWDDAANWTNGVPRLQDQTAAFAADDSRSRMIKWVDSRTIGGISFHGKAPFVVGDTASGLMLARSERATATVTVAGTTGAPQEIVARVELWSDGQFLNRSTRPLTVSGPVVGVGGLTIEGSGSTVLTNEMNTYAGPTLVDAGNLLVNGRHMGGGPYRVASGGTLGGTGTINPATGGTLTVSGTLSPGHEVGTFGALTVGSSKDPADVAFTAGGVLQLELAANGVGGLLRTFGTLDLAADDDTLALFDRGDAFDGSTHTLATFKPGTLGSERFGAVTLDGEQFDPATQGYRLTYDDAGGRLLLAPDAP